MTAELSRIDKHNLAEDKCFRKAVKTINSLVKLYPGLDEMALIDYIMNQAAAIRHRESLRIIPENK